MIVEGLGCQYGETPAPEGLVELKLGISYEWSPVFGLGTKTWPSRIHNESTMEIFWVLRRHLGNPSLLVTVDSVEPHKTSSDAVRVPDGSGSLVVEGGGSSSNNYVPSSSLNKDIPRHVTVRSYPLM